MRILTSLITIVASAACGKTSPARHEKQAPRPPKQHTGPAPTCDAVADHMLELQLAASTVNRNDDAELAGFKAGIKPAIEKVRTQCEDEPWSTAERWCMSDIEPSKNAVAVSEAFAACDRAAMIERGVDMGGPPCDQVADHLSAISQGELTDRATLMKKCANLDRPTKECAMRATDMDAFLQCGATQGASPSR